MKQDSSKSREVWERSFQEQIRRGAYNTAPVEALVRNAAYHLRSVRPDGDYSGLHFLEMGCGAGPNLVWLAEKGIRVSGIDIAPQALTLCRELLDGRGHAGLVGEIVEGSVAATPFESESFDGILESCVFQHLDQETRVQTFAEVGRLLKPGGAFIGNMLSDEHTVYLKHRALESPSDPGTLDLRDKKSDFYLTNIGLTHFFREHEFKELLQGFSVVDPCRTSWRLPQFEAETRGYPEYIQAMWNVYAVK